MFNLNGFQSLRTRPLPPVELSPKPRCQKCGAVLRASNPGPLCAPCAGVRLPEELSEALLALVDEDAPATVAIVSMYERMDCKTRYQYIRHLAALGFSHGEIARLMGMPRTSVSYALKAGAR